MTILKCKMCGGDIELTSDKTLGTCEYCGNTTTFPQINDDQRAAAFNRGNHFRRIGEFDKALAVYERIVQEDDADAEAHWCCALCRFGIEYVEDPITYEWLPTCHRASFDSFIEDVDYKAALEYSEGITQRQYMKDGAKIAEVQKGILITSQNSEPYDVFICYKETDENGERTRDSIMAQEIYYQLTDQGRKVFFSRITLEDVVGAQYEPYIFAALNSAKVMIVVGSKPEYLNAVWVKNEWSRFLAMMKKDHQKLLLPCYKDMDPYDLPEQLSVLQSYDMSKIGFIQDLIRGVSKVLDADKKAETVQETIMLQQSGVTNIVPLLKRAFIFLEDGDWNSADEYCEKVLDIDPECAQAYLGKLLAKLKVKKIEYLADSEVVFEAELLYQKVIRFADTDLKEQLESYNEKVKERKEISRCQKIYDLAKDKMISAKTSQDFRDVTTNFEKIPGFLDSDDLKAECHTKIIELLELERIQKEEAEERNRIEEARRAEEEKIKQLKLAEQKREKAAKRKRNARIISIICVVTLLIAAGFYASVNYVIPAMKYNQAGKALENNSFEEAITIYTELDNYKDSKEKITECRYEQAKWYLEKEEYILAIDTLREIESYKDSSALIEENLFSYAKNLMTNKQYKEAIGIFEANENVYEEARELRQEASYYYALELSEKENYEQALEYFDKAFKFADTQDKKIEIKYKYACQLLENDEPQKAMALFSACSGYLDADKKINDAKYKYVILEKDREKDPLGRPYFNAVVYEYLMQLKEIGYPNAKDLYDEYYKEHYDIIWQDEQLSWFSIKEKH